MVELFDFVRILCPRAFNARLDLADGERGKMKIAILDALEEPNSGDFTKRFMASANPQRSNPPSYPLAYDCLNALFCRKRSG
jgi:hypothetical protein